MCMIYPKLQLPSLTPLPSFVLIICPSCFYCCLLYLNSFRRGRPNQKAHFLKWVGTDVFYSMTAVQQLWLLGPMSWQCCSNVAAMCCLCLRLPPEEKGWMYVWSVWGLCSIVDSIIDHHFELPSPWRAESGMNRVGHSHCEVLKSTKNKNWLWTSWSNLQAICLFQLKM